jgi:hypothetical protein
LISLASRIGSPATKGERAMAPGELLDRVRLVGSAHEGGTCRLCRPLLPLHVLRRHRLAEIDIAARDQDVDGIHLDGFDGRRGRRGIAAAPGEQCRDTAGGHRNHENNETRGFHTLHFPQ